MYDKKLLFIVTTQTCFHPRTPQTLLEQDRAGNSRLWLIGHPFTNKTGGIHNILNKYLCQKLKWK